LVYCRVYKNTPLAPSLSHIHPIHTTKSCSLRSIGYYHLIRFVTLGFICLFRNFSSAMPYALHFWWERCCRWQRCPSEWPTVRAHYVHHAGFRSRTYNMYLTYWIIMELRNSWT
jgi:hypothetical protein